MKKILIVIITFAMSLGLVNVSTINAKDISETTQEYSEETILKIEELTFKITENDSTRTVITENSETGEVYTAIYDKATQMLHDEHGNYIGRGYTTIDLSTRGNFIAGPFRTKFDVNPESVGAIIGSILAVSSFVSAAAVAGVGKAALSAGLSKFFKYGGDGSLLNAFFPGVSVNGYFEYSQENNFTTHKARNLNRKLAVRIGYKNKYSTYSYGNGSWFDTQKP